MDLEELFLNNSSTKYSLAFKFQIALGFFVLYAILNRFFKQSVYSIILSCVIFFTLNSIIKRYNIQKSDKNKILLNKINILQNVMYNYVDEKYKNLPLNSGVPKEELYKKVELDYLYTDANLVSFLHQNLYLNKFNKEEFFNLVKKTNTFLKFKSSFLIKEQKYKSKLLSTCIALKKELLNIFHRFIYSTPKMKEMYTQLYEARTIFHKLLDRNLDEMALQNSRHLNWPSPVDHLDNVADAY